ncbi:hypothetical protein N3K66_004087 [Trichothecium roseum]|uniref:Uncharacterized protein n=1 Tax=Trichothecium roseum TaxID=47278 RepID=A0ACC0V8Q3_9HYPO|nr:hypothetical protein N3K66_004087 [Trichothecium roseum]
MQPTASPMSFGAQVTVQEGEARIKLCQEIAVGGKLPQQEMMLDPYRPGKEVVEYSNGFNFVTILGELLAHNRARRLTRIVIEDSTLPENDGTHTSCCESEYIPKMPGLGASELRYLREKQAFHLPAEPHCYEMFKCYFHFAYPFCPVIDRVEFLQSYKMRRYSPFILQAILLNASQYAPTDLLVKCGFPDRLSAQKVYFTRASLLYDLGCERNQLRMLQGSIILGTCVFTYSMDKDFRFWLQNAARIAIKMGLHERDIVDDVDPTIYKLCRRNWWVIYTCDVLTSIMGWKNMRMLDRNECRVESLSEADWDEEHIPPEFSHVISPMRSLEKLFFINFAKLAYIADQCLACLKSQTRIEPHPSLDHVPQPFETWRASVPPLLQVQQHPKNPGDSVLPLTLMATSYRLECILYREMRKRCRPEDEDRQSWASQRLRVSLHELDTLIGRTMVLELQDLLSMGMVSCASTSLALRIESALSDTESEINKSLTHVYIRQGIAFFRQMRDMPTVKESIRLFEWVLKEKGLSSIIGDLADESPKMGKTEIPQAPSGIEHHVEDIQTEDVGDQDLWLDDILGFDFTEKIGLQSDWSIIEMADENIVDAAAPDAASEQAERLESIAIRHRAVLGMQQHLNVDLTRHVLSVGSDHVGDHLTTTTLAGPGAIFPPPFVYKDDTEGALLAFYYLGRKLSGHNGLVHGGVSATLLDECMGRATFPRLTGKIAVTANLQVDYRAPIKVDSVVLVRANVTECEGRKVWVRGVIEDAEEGTVFVEAKGLFIEPKWSASLGKLL